METEIMPQEMALARVEAKGLSLAEVKTQVHRIQEIVRDVMIENTHYGIIPGTTKPSLWQPGAETLALTFNFALSPKIDEGIRTDDEVRYRIRTEITHQVTGTFMGAAYGECSSQEEKYRWRQAVCQAEWEEADENARRKKWRRDGTAVLQVQTHPADQANTILKMAVKRSKVAAVLQVTAASDCFTQDLEDYEVVDEGAPVNVTNGRPENGHTQAPQAPPPPAQKSAAPPAADVISEPQAKRFYAIWRGRAEAGWNQESVNQLLKDHGITHDRAIPRRHYDALCKLIQAQTAAQYEQSKGSAA